MMEMSLTSSLRKVKQDILIVFHAREILIPEDRLNVAKLL